MAIRVSQRQIYSSLVTNMNSTLSEYMKLQEQSSSQLRINRPSDDPIGAAKVLTSRASLARIGQYDSSIKAAKGWLSTMDSALTGEGSIMTVLTRIKTLAQQVSSGTYDETNRKEVSFEIREAFNQLINLSNSTFEGRHVFGGHKSDRPAFVEALGVTSHDATFDGLSMTAKGGAANTVLIQFTGPGAGGSTASTAEFRYSKDGGATWETGTASLAPNGTDAILDAGGVEVTIHNGATQPVTFVDPDNKNETNNGTWVYVRPSAIYQGDDHDTQVVTRYGAAQALNPTADGDFARDVAVKIDKIQGGVITYYYSSDDGNNWVMATAPDEGANTRLPIPGGFLKLDNSGNDLAVGNQFVVEPRRADINMTISNNDTITVNLIGKDVFGGLYQEPFADPAVPTVVGDPSLNMFEVVGRLVAYTETNSQDGIQKCLEDLEKVMGVITTKAAVVGGRQNRLEVTEAALGMRKLDETEHLSSIEDIDVTELMTKISQQQIAYNSVLKTSSMVMQMSLLNFL